MPQYIRSNPWMDAAGATSGIGNALSKLFLQLPQAQAQARLMALTGQETQARTGLLQAQTGQEGQKTQDLQDASTRAALAEHAARAINYYKSGGISPQGPTVQNASDLSMGDLLSALTGQAASDPKSSEALLNWHNTPSGAVGSSPLFGQVNNPAPVRPTILKPNETAINPQTGGTIADAVLHLLNPGQQMTDSTGNMVAQNQTPKQFSPREYLPSDTGMAYIDKYDTSSMSNIVKNVLVPFANSASQRANMGQTPINNQPPQSPSGINGGRVRFQTPDGRTGTMDRTDKLPSGWKIIQ